MNCPFCVLPQFKGTDNQPLAFLSSPFASSSRSSCQTMQGLFSTSSYQRSCQMLPSHSSPLTKLASSSLSSSSSTPSSSKLQPLLQGSKRKPGGGASGCQERHQRRIDGNGEEGLENGSRRAGGLLHPPRGGGEARHRQRRARSCQSPSLFLRQSLADGGGDWRRVPGRVSSSPSSSCAPRRRGA